MIQLSSDAVVILNYLLATTLNVERTFPAIRERCQMSSRKRLRQALHELIRAGYVVATEEDTFELAHAGRTLAENNQKPAHTTYTIQQNIDRIEGGHVELTGLLPTLPPSADEEDETEPYDTALDEDTVPRSSPSPQLLPTLHQHPLRSHKSPATNGNGRHQVDTIRYVLSFKMPEDALPVPIMHNDIVGRSSQADIWLRHDSYISNLHCRFRIHVNPKNDQYVLSVQNLSTSNGTRVNGHYIDDEIHPLKDGSQIRIGLYTLLIVNRLHV